MSCTQICDNLSCPGYDQQAESLCDTCQAAATQLPAAQPEAQVDKISPVAPTSYVHLDGLSAEQVVERLERNIPGDAGLLDYFVNTSYGGRRIVHALLKRLHAKQRYEDLKAEQAIVDQQAEAGLRLLERLKADNEKLRNERHVADTCCTGLREALEREQQKTLQLATQLGQTEARLFESEGKVSALRTEKLPDKMSQEPQELVSGLKFSIVPQYELIPRISMLRLIIRSELGQKNKGPHAWNALSGNQTALLDRAALIKRLGHSIDHAYKLIEKVINNGELFNLAKEDDDAAAIMWAGNYAICATQRMTDARDSTARTTDK